MKNEEKNILKRNSNIEELIEEEQEDDENDNSNHDNAFIND